MFVYNRHFTIEISSITCSVYFLNDTEYRILEKYGNRLVTFDDKKEGNRFLSVKMFYTRFYNIIDQKMYVLIVIKI